MIRSMLPFFRVTNSFDADAQAFFTASGITNLTQKNAVNQLVLDLKSANIWTKMKALYPVVGGNATAHSYNLKNTSQYQLTFSSGWTHSSTGMLPNGTSAYADTGLAISNATFAQNNSFGVYVRSSSVYGNDIGGGGVAGGARFYLYSNVSSGLTWMANGGYTNVSDSNNKGFYVNSKTSTNFASGYRNATRIINESGSFNYLGTSNSSIYIGAYNENGTAKEFASKQYAFSFIADGLNQTEEGNLYTAVQAFQTSLSRQI